MKNKRNPTKAQIDNLVKTDVDRYLLILGLVNNMGWSFYRVGKLFALSPHTVKSIYEKALEKKYNNELHEIASSEGAIRISYVGGTQELEQIEGAIIDRQMGRRPTGHKADE